MTARDPTHRARSRAIVRAVAAVADSAAPPASGGSVVEIGGRVFCVTVALYRVVRSPRTRRRPQHPGRRCARRLQGGLCPPRSAWARPLGQRPEFTTGGTARSATRPRPNTRSPMKQRDSKTSRHLHTGWSPLGGHVTGKPGDRGPPRPPERPWHVEECADEMLRSPAVFFLRGAHPQDLVRPKCPEIRLTRQDSSDSLRPAFHAASLLRGEKPGRVLVTEAMEPPMRNSVFVSVGTALGVAVPILATGPGGSDCWTSRSTTCCKEIERGIFRSAAPNGLHCTIDPITDTDMQMLQQASSGLSRYSF